ncbi:MAG: MerR family transcriptional regulator [Candidatus Eisenbacteria bacterium]|uniref:MerR family transcriptional regulator n=1 Tax=Eiseniibacteriota bacterium TaxID=2212470 RepID=A0A849SNT1_UNCEI|nr:MerR family transcriptional regulator [Candidatus Eisenbacteria bacterium]
MRAKTDRIRVGDLARETGKTVRAIHLYEEMGLLTPVTRTSGGFRLYDRSAIDRVKWMDMLHGLGFSLQEMRDVLREWWQADLGPDAMKRLREVFEERLIATRETIKRQRELEHELLAGLAYLETCNQCGTNESAVGCVHCELDHGVAREPVLVAGFKSAPERGSGARSNRSSFVPLAEIAGSEVKSMDAPARGPRSRA